MIVRKYTEFLVEKLDIEDITGKFGDDYTELKTDLTEMIEETMKNTRNTELRMTDIEDFITDYISSGKDAKLIDKLIEDNDIFNFYLKHQSDIDKFLYEGSKYMDETPVEHNVYTLYDVIMDGTKQAILEILKVIQQESFNKE
jgi:hypothetical protein